eukprot:3450634-Pyramimonas_sp.AAC.1
MFLYDVATDPLLRWLRDSSSHHFSINLACADDLLFGLVNTLRDLGPALHGLQTFAAVANLELNFKKCQIMGCGELDLCTL